MNRSVTKLALATLFWSLAWTVSAEEKNERDDCDRRIVPASFLPTEVCESRAQGSECPGYLVWNQEDFFGPCLSDFDRRFVFPHELFHAVQFGYRPFRELWCGTEGVSTNGPGGWLIEGMAEAVALDWADSRGFSFAPAPGTNWRYDGYRFYSCPLHRPSNALSYYATSSFWRFLKRKCGSHAIFQAVLENDEKRVEQCPTITGKKPEKVRPADDFDKRFWIIGADAKPLTARESDHYQYALHTAWAYYRDAGFKPPCLRYDPAPDWSSSTDYVIQHVESSKDTGTPEGPTEQPLCPKEKHGGAPDKKILKRVDKVLSHFVTRMCSGGRNAAKLEGFCGKFQDAQFGGLAVAYLAFINEFFEELLSGKRPLPSGFGADAGHAPRALFSEGCIPSENGIYRFDLPELASECIQSPRGYSADKGYYVIASGPKNELQRLQLGWHGCHTAPISTNLHGEKVWALKRHLGRPGCGSQRDEYTLVFSNVAPKAHQTTPISGVTVRIEAQVEGEGNQE